MSLGIVIKGPEGLVIAAESRVTITMSAPGMQPLNKTYDNATKLMTFAQHHYVASVTYGLGGLNMDGGIRTPHSFMPEFEAFMHGKDRMSVRKFAESLSDFFQGQFKKSQMPTDASLPGMIFVVGGFDIADPYGKVFEFTIPHHAKPTERFAAPEAIFGMRYGGQIGMIHRLYKGYDPRFLDLLVQKEMLTKEEVSGFITEYLEQMEIPIPFTVLPLQDCVDLAILLIGTTNTMQHLAIGEEGCGGAIDIVTITRREGVKYIQQKTITGEGKGNNNA